MIAEKKSAVAVLLLIFLFFLGFSLFINLPIIYNNFLFADQAVYFSMTQSIAYDGDLEYTRKDLLRYYQNFDAGPLGIFLKKGKEGKIFYAKSFAYSLLAAPFVRIFGQNGFYVFHALLLLLVLLMGYSYLSLFNPPWTSAAAILTFLFASVSYIYYFWIQPDFFNLCLVFIVLYLWLYKEKSRELLAHRQEQTFLARFLHSSASDYLATFLAGVVTFSKPSNAVLLVPLFLFSLLKKKIRKSFFILFLFLLTLILFFGTNYLLTSDWNYMGGERKTFYGPFPLEKDSVTFDSTGVLMTSERYFERFLLPFKCVFYNLFYYFFGRFTGMAWYYFPAFLFLVLFFLGKKRLEQWLVFAALGVEILLYIILMPDNYNGGGGAVANRYFLSIYPFFFFLPSMIRRKKELLFSWVMAALFVSQILVNPIRSSAFPASHVKKWPFKLLPVEMTIINNIPTNTNPNAFRVEFGTPPHVGYMHFLDDNFLPRQEPNGIWTRGHGEAEMILKTYYPLQKIIVHLTNNPRLLNEITVKVEGKKKKIALGPKQKGTLQFPLGKGFNMESIYLYKLKIKASKGSIPYYEDQASLERRFLGVFFELELIPKN